MDFVDKNSLMSLMWVKGSQLSCALENPFHLTGIGVVGVSSLHPRFVQLPTLVVHQ
jgi:hypothetical protein